MIYKASDNLASTLVSLPETGMGYQVVELKSFASQRRIIFLNSCIGFETQDMGRSIELKEAKTADFNIDISNIVIDNEKGALEGKEETATGSALEKFVRLSAFRNDLRIDQENKCLRPGSFTTNLPDYLTLTINGNDPIERYALPNTLPICHLFYIGLRLGDVFQRGIVQPAFNSSGGGIEFFFKSGTSRNTLISVNNHP